MRWNYQLSNDTSKLVSVGGFPLDPNATLIPCGNIAHSFFNDNFELYSTSNEYKKSKIPINETGIAYEIDKKLGFKNRPDYLKTQWINMEDEHFMVWMNMETFHDFNKFWGRIDQDLPKGEYKLLVDYNWPSTPRGVSKSFRLSCAQTLGAASFFGWSLLKAAVVLLFSLILLFCIKTSQKQKFEEEDLKW